MFPEIETNYIADKCTVKNIFFFMTIIWAFSKHYWARRQQTDNKVKEIKK